MPISHILIKVGAADHAAVVKFYNSALAPLGSSQLMALPNGWTAFGSTKPEWWVAKADVAPNTGTHVAFGAPDRAAVDAFHKNALASGGKDNGPPGVRSHINPKYYAAFVLDPAGNNIEAACILSDEEAASL